MNGAFTAKDGISITNAQINGNGTINGLFTDAEIWTVENGKLPGLFGKTVDMPEHLKYTPLTWYTDKSSPYVITHDDELVEFAALVNDGTDNFTGKTVVLAADIDLSSYGENWNGGKGWVPIGTNGARFSGTFDGAGHTISSLYINNSAFDLAGLFGYVSGGTVKNLGATTFRIRGGDNVGGLAGTVTDGGNISNCYVSGTSSVAGFKYVGGVVGQALNTNITDCYSAVTVRDIMGDNGSHSGGVAGNVTGGSVANCYSLGQVDGSRYSTIGNDNIGGVVGSVYTSGNRAGSVLNCAALNYNVSGDAQVDSVLHIGRVVGYFEEGTILSGNIAFSGIIGDFGDTDTTGTTGADSIVAVNSSAAYTLVTVDEIYADGTLNGIFSDPSIWTTANGRLPGLFGETVEMPTHLGGTWNVPVLSNDRVIPRGNTSEVAVVAPAAPLADNLTPGPNPVDKNSGVVNFLRHGSGIKSGTLAVYDASGNFVKKIGVSDKSTETTAKRVVASWDLRDKKGRSVSDGTYLIRGTITTVDGKRDVVSVVVGVR